MPTQISNAQAQEMLETLKAIDRRARSAYGCRAFHDEEISTLGMMAENAILKIDEDYDGKINR